MLALLASLRRNRRLLKDFVVRDLKARYVGSSMGFFWSVLFPIVNLLVFMFVFRLILNARWGDHQGPLEVALAMLAGIVVWTAFAETISRGTNCLVENANLIQKVVFPSELLPVYLTISSLINMCIGLPVVLLSVLYFGHLATPDVLLTADVQDAHEQSGTVLVTVGLERGQSREVRVPYTLEGSATRGEDYLAEEGTFVFPPGALVSSVAVTLLPDRVPEEEETVVVRLGEPQGAVLLNEPTHTIRVADGPPPEPGVAPPQHDPAPPDLIDPGYHTLRLGPQLLLLPVLFVLQVAFTAGLGFLLSTINLFLRDTFHLVGVFITVWMFATPIFYPAQLVQKADFGWILQLNPMYWLIDSYRDVVLYGIWPDWFLLGRFAVVAVLVLYLGSSFFLSQKHRFPDLL